MALHDWLDEGGKVFASHYHYTWFKDGPPDFKNVATWLGTSTANGTGNFAIDTSFPKGKTYHDWLANVGALSRNGTIALNSVATSVSTVNPPTTRWIYDSNERRHEVPVVSHAHRRHRAGARPRRTPGRPAGMRGMPQSTQDAASADGTADASVDAADEAAAEAADRGRAAVGPSDAGPAEMSGPTFCGKAVFTDLHTSSSLYSTVNNIPDGCSGAPMTAQQKALEFLFFDLSACVSTDSVPPPPPPPPTR